MAAKKKKKQSSSAKMSKEEYIKKYERYLTSYTTRKTSIKSIVKHPDMLKTINDAVIMVNKIRIHTYHFLKMYVLYSFFADNKIPTITPHFIMCIMKTLCYRDARGRNPSEETQEINIKLQDFYDSEYEPTMSMSIDKLQYTYLNTVLDYESGAIYTNFCNHIKNHYYDFVNKFVNRCFNKKAAENNIKKDQTLSSDERKLKVDRFRKCLRTIKNDLLSHEDNCDHRFDSFKKMFRESILPKVDKNLSLTAQVNNDPLYFFESVIKMSLYLERRFNSPINCFPLQKSIIPKYIRLDTTTIIHLLFTEGMHKSFYLSKGNTLFYAGFIWNLFFRTEKKVFKDKKYKFRFEIMTDGIGCSILFIRNDLYREDKKMFVPSMNKPYRYKTERYVTALTDTEKMAIKNKDLVGIDPNKDDLIYCANGYLNENTGKHVTFRYTQNQRRQETKKKKYMRIREYDKLEPCLVNLNVNEIENILVSCNFDSCNYYRVVEDISSKNVVNATLHEYYEKDLFRKLKWYSHVNKKRSESWMLNKFEKMFGYSNNTVIAYGDWGQHSQLKYKEPTIGKGMRDLLRSRGYMVLLVDEFNTSKRNHFTGGELENFRRRKNPRPWMNNIRYQHGLLRSKSTLNNDPCKHMLLNRDLNASLNIRQKAHCVIHNVPLPDYLQRM